MPTPEEAALGLMDNYIRALNDHDSEAMRAVFHFPHYRFAGGKVSVFERPEDLSFAEFERRTKADGWAHSEWDERRVIHADADKVHLEVRFTRYRADGSAIGSYDSIWIATTKQDRWGILARSSFAG
jgi:hypothetical protein